MKKILLLLCLAISIASCKKENDADLTAGSETTTTNRVAQSTVAANQTPFYWATNLIQNIPSTNNSYVLQMDVLTWTGEHGATAYRCSTVCSGFITQVLIQTYNYTSSYFNTWTGWSDPDAAHYYNVIVAQNHFTQINNVSQILQGDYIALKYPSGSSSSGHIMLVASVPILRTPSAPLVAGTTQYEISVMDCSSSGHGSTDTRYISSGVFHTGAGRGIFRLYVNSIGTVVGYCWSTYSSSTYYSQSQRQLAVGRLIP